MINTAWIVLEIFLGSCALSIAVTIVVDQIFKRLSKRCPMCGRFMGKDIGRQVIPGTLKKDFKGGYEYEFRPRIKAKFTVYFKCLSCGHKWTQIKSMIRPSL